MPLIRRIPLLATLPFLWLSEARASLHTPTSEAPLYSTQTTPHDPPVEQSPRKSTRFMNATSFGYGAGVGNYTVTLAGAYPEVTASNTDHYLRFETINGLAVMEGSASIGIGIGYERYPEGANEVIAGNGGFSQLPLFLDIRLYPGQGRVSPVFIGQAGYSFSAMPLPIPRTDLATSQITVIAQDVPLNGIEVAAGAGVLYRFTSRVAAHFNVLYDYQRLSYNLMLLHGQRNSLSPQYNIRSGAVRFCAGLTF